jgi:hypothetical protein
MITMSTKVRIRMRIGCTCELNFHASEFSAPSYVRIFRAHTRRRGLPSRRRNRRKEGRMEGKKVGRKEEGRKEEKRRKKDY